MSDVDLHLRPFGWAPGGYSFHCQDCTPVGASIKDLPTGDKRAWRCRPCAEQALARQAAATGVAEVAPTLTPQQDIEDLVQRFSEALRAKLVISEAKHRWKGHWRRDGWLAELRAELLLHVDKGDPRDVAAYCAFAWHHGWSLAPTPPARTAQQEEANRASLRNHWLSCGRAMERRQVHIVAAACRYDNVTYRLPPPARHGDVLELMRKLLPQGTGGLEQQGFVTNNDHFVGREEACVIARSAGQILHKTGPEDVLFSECVW
ncbi:hypothetical protein [Roseococcus pinisoli]|uniref:Uncharacterized protein n=1 Tax=Roseococcus pinisoli TaxID=2835040 RepID=A0ABS5QF45_9PROT|nr:hypothetical protein [Roseococcus pinisoli]MBS7812311.1 hypothetical protein [Roseococcus pinisoli]